MNPNFVRPPHHPDVLKDKQAHGHHSSNHATPNAGHTEVVQLVYGPELLEVLWVPESAVSHIPRSGLHVKKLVLCQFYDVAEPDKCPKGSRCKYVHTSLTKAQLAALHKTTVHVNYAWRTLDVVGYERYEAGNEMKVAAPDGTDVTDTMDSSFALKTKALTDGQQQLLQQQHSSTGKPPVLRHCAHYYYNRTCNLGPDCHFVHAVFIDPKACKNQRAPAPCMLGRQSSSSQRGPGSRPPSQQPSPSSFSSPLAAPPQHAVTTASSAPSSSQVPAPVVTGGQRRATPSSNHATPMGGVAGTMHFSSRRQQPAAGSPSHGTAPLRTPGSTTTTPYGGVGDSMKFQSGCTSPGCSPGSMGTGMRFRHDPYSPSSVHTLTPPVRQNISAPVEAGGGGSLLPPQAAASSTTASAPPPARVYHDDSGTASLMPPAAASGPGDMTSAPPPPPHYPPQPEERYHHAHEFYQHDHLHMQQPPQPVPPYAQQQQQQGGYPPHHHQHHHHHHAYQHHEQQHPGAGYPHQ